MHTEKDLKSLVSKCKSAAVKRGVDLIIQPTNGQNLFVLANLKEKKLVTVGLLDEGETQQLVAYVINSSKWRWYEEEGFTEEQITNSTIIRNDIFEPIPINKIIKYLL